MPRDSPRASEDLRALVHRNAHSIGAEVLDALATFAMTAREVCDNDADKALIMTVIALRANMEPTFRAMTLDERAAAEGAVFPSLGVNISSLSRATGIPKETVRRKVHQLVDKGWVARVGPRLAYTHEGYVGLRPAALELERVVARFGRLVGRLAHAGLEGSC